VAYSTTRKAKHYFVALLGFIVNKMLVLSAYLTTNNTWTLLKSI